MASLERQRPDVVISAGSFDDEVVLARALLASGLRLKAVCLAAAAMQEFPHALGTHAEGFFGRFHIDPATGLQVGHEVVVVQWRRGRKLVVWPPAFSQARPLYPRRRSG